MERKELLGINGKIFIGQGQAIAKMAAPDVRVLVVGNPCNTNCLIAMNNARTIPRDRWFAMTMLDQNRAVAQLARKAGADVSAVSHLAIWGNHSSTMYPDFENARIGGKPATAAIGDPAWFKDVLIPTVQQSGAPRSSAGPRRLSSAAASAANAVVDTVRALTTPNHGRAISFSVSVCTRRRLRHRARADLLPYPIRSNGTKWEIVRGLSLSEFARSKVIATENELKEEKSLIGDLIPKS